MQNYNSLVKDLSSLPSYSFASANDVLNTLEKHGLLTCDSVDLIFQRDDGIINYDDLVTFLDNRQAEYIDELDDIEDTALEDIKKGISDSYEVSRYHELQSIIEDIDGYINTSSHDGLYCLIGPYFDDFRQLRNRDVTDFLKVILRPEDSTKSSKWYQSKCWQVSDNLLYLYT